MNYDVFKCVTIFHYSSHQHQTSKKISQSPQENPNLSSLGILKANFQQSENPIILGLQILLKKKVKSLKDA